MKGKGRKDGVLFMMWFAIFVLLGLIFFGPSDRFDFWPYEPELRSGKLEGIDFIGLQKRQSLFSKKTYMMSLETGEMMFYQFSIPGIYTKIRFFGRKEKNDQLLILCTERESWFGKKNEHEGLEKVNGLPDKVLRDMSVMRRQMIEKIMDGITEEENEKEVDLNGEIIFL